MTPRTVALIEDAEFLTINGEWPDRIAKRLGFKNRDSLATALKRRGQHELADQMRRNDRTSTYYRLATVDDEDRKLANERHGRR